MIIINADDWGRSRGETDAALTCHKEGRITSVTAMVFMQDSRRAADLARNREIDVGLHLNLSQHFTNLPSKGSLRTYQDQIVSFIAANKYSFLIYHPTLRKQLHYVYQAQIDEFIELYGVPPSHIDGHHHKHLCTNMLVDRVIPAGEKVRRNFSYWPGDKALLNLLYRRLVDQWLARRYKLTDYFFALSECLDKKFMTRVVELSRSAKVELMTHPHKANEYGYLMSDEYFRMLCGLQKGTYSSL
jgi:predicted glycoside hydrolase/deacetylase ChbG (UPF0249 family)